MSDKLIQYVTYGAFGREVSDKLGKNPKSFSAIRIRKILWWADEVGRDGFDKTFSEGEPLIALTDKNIEKFINLLPDWAVEAERRRKVVYRDPLEVHFIPPGQLRVSENCGSEYARNYDRFRNKNIKGP
jgi:hypothetical protein